MPDKLILRKKLKKINNKKSAPKLHQCFTVECVNLQTKVLWFLKYRKNSVFHKFQFWNISWIISWNRLWISNHTTTQALSRLILSPVRRFASTATGSFPTLRIIGTFGIKMEIFWLAVEKNLLSLTMWTEILLVTILARFWIKILNFVKNQRIYLSKSTVYAMEVQRSVN